MSSAGDVLDETLPSAGRRGSAVGYAHPAHRVVVLLDEARDPLAVTTWAARFALGRGKLRVVISASSPVSPRVDEAWDVVRELRTRYRAMSVDLAVSSALSLRDLIEIDHQCVDLVVATGRRGMSGLLAGATQRGLVDRICWADIPVAVVPPTGARWENRPIVVLVDHATPAPRALAYAFSRAREHGVTVRILALRNDVDQPHEPMSPRGVQETYRAERKFALHLHYLLARFSTVPFDVRIHLAGEVDRIVAASSRASLLIVEHESDDIVDRVAATGQLPMVILPPDSGELHPERCAGRR